ncbi:hypothetical protein F4808DRAFT_418304 [Astrocystis sublimbata]|nr:hypothetical protein F4808DRAFT_418304 [Astrocystis sublimbata]
MFTPCLPTRGSLIISRDGATEIGIWAFTTRLVVEVEVEGPCSRARGSEGEGGPLGMGFRSYLDTEKKMEFSETVRLMISAAMWPPFVSAKRRWTKHGNVLVDSQIVDRHDGNERGRGIGFHDVLLVCMVVIREKRRAFLGNSTRGCNLLVQARSVCSHRVVRARRVGSDTMTMAVSAFLRRNGRGIGVVLRITSCSSCIKIIK